MGAYRKSEAVVTREIAGETMLVPIRGSIADMERLFALDEVSAFIWDRIDGSHDVPALAAAVTEEFDVAGDTALTDTREFLAELLAAGLIEEETGDQLAVDRKETTT